MTAGAARGSVPRSDAPPTVEDRELARAAAAALRAAFADPATMGEPSVMHVDYGRPRRGEWITTWPGLPGFVRADGSNGRRYTHAALPSWEYGRHEIRSEMIPDLDALAAHGELPTLETNR